MFFVLFSDHHEEGQQLNQPRFRGRKLWPVNFTAAATTSHGI